MATVLDSPVQEVHRVGVVPPRFGQRVVLIPGSPDATPESIHNRFAALAEEDPVTRDGHVESVQVGRRHRLVIVPPDVRPPSASPRDDFVDGSAQELRVSGDARSSHIPVEVIPMSDGSDQEFDGAVPGPVTHFRREEGDHRMTRAIQEGLQSLDFVNVQSVPPAFLRRMYKSALRVIRLRDERRHCRAWKLLLLLLRLFLFRLARGGLLPKRHLQERFKQFMRGQ